MARIRIDRADLRRARGEASQLELREGVRQVVNRAKVLTPVDTGRLRASIKASTTIYRATVFTNVKYAKFVHDGTNPHVIRPVRRQALRFNVGGQVVFARYVNHPGTRSRPFLTRALRQIARQRGWRYLPGGIE